jgi:hypothetical protein
MGVADLHAAEHCAELRRGAGVLVVLAALVLAASTVAAPVARAWCMACVGTVDSPQKAR